MKREKGENFKDYKERRKKENKRIKEYLKGKLIWNVKQYGPYKRKYANSL